MFNKITFLPEAKMEQKNHLPSQTTANWSSSTLRFEESLKFAVAGKGKNEFCENEVEAKCNVEKLNLYEEESSDSQSNKTEEYNSESSEDFDWFSNLPMEYIIDIENFITEAIEDYLEEEIEGITSPKFHSKMIIYISELLYLQIEDLLKGVYLLKNTSTLSFEESLNFASTSFPQNSFSPTLRFGENVNIPTFEETENIVKNVCEEFFKNINIPIPPRSYSTTFLTNKTREEKEEIKLKINKLREQYQPKQRTPEWYEYRNKILTASNIWKAFGTECQRNSLIYEKCSAYVENPPFPLQATENGSFYTLRPEESLNSEEDLKPYNIKVVKLDADSVDFSKNEFCGNEVEAKDQFAVSRGEKVGSSLHHGIKYEPLSAMIYEIEYNTKIDDFGCITHTKYPFIGASPDGINIDENTDRYGRMLEIKNITNREINGIPKEEYWVQMQIQMETCDLDECDFVETRFKEYESEDNFYEEPEETTGKLTFLAEASPEPKMNFSECNVEKLTFSPERSVGENEFCENEVEAKLRNYTEQSVEEDQFAVDGEEKCGGIFENKKKVNIFDGGIAGAKNEFCGNEVEAKDGMQCKKIKGVILYFIDKVTVKESVPHYVYLPPFYVEPQKRGVTVLMEASPERKIVNKMIEDKIKEFKETEEGKNKILYEKIYWYLDQFSCVLVKRNKLWFNKVLPKIIDISKTIQRERVEGFDHRASNRVKKIKGI